VANIGATATSHCTATARNRPTGILAIVLSVLGLVNFPFGTALGAYGLWVLLSKSTGPVFSLAPTATGGPLTSPTGAAPPS